jgi:hypothetical protein
MMQLASWLEYSSAADPPRNYCLWDYVSPVPAEDKFRAVNLLLQSFDHAGAGAEGLLLVNQIRAAIGSFQTVFGIKMNGGQLSWEFYFYDYQREQRAVGVNRVLEACAALLRCPLRVDETLPYFMFSLDIDHALLTGQRDTDVVHVYIGNPGSTVSSGICYAMRAESTVLENFYFFFDAATQMTEVKDKLCSSMHFNASRHSFDSLLLPELGSCQTICIANKPGNDCIYYSGIDIVQLQLFLRHFQYPPSVQEFVQTHRGMLDHLLFDVGIDFCLEEGAVRLLKSGYFGVF